jgi:hypothetical protein
MTTDHPELGDALAAGELTTTHIVVLTKVATPRRRHLVAEHLDTLLDAAAVLSVDGFTTAARRWAALADDQITNTDAAQQYERRGLHLSTTMGGMVLLDGAFPATQGATVIAALDSLAPPDPADAPDGPHSATDMAILYLDSSALVKLVVEDHGSDVAAALWDGADAVISSGLAYPEVRAALAAAGRDDRISA